MSQPKNTGAWTAATSEGRVAANRATQRARTRAYRRLAKMYSLQFDKIYAEERIIARIEEGLD